MTFKAVATVLISSLALGFTQEPGDDSIEGLIKNLGNTNFKLREHATKALMARTDAEPALHAVIPSAEAEIAKRAAFILNHFENRRIAQIRKAIDQGRAESVIESIAKWPEGDRQHVLWECVELLRSALVERHDRSAAAIGSDLKRTLPTATGSIKSACFTESRSNLFHQVGALFLRAENVDYDASRREELPNGQEISSLSTVSAGPARYCEVSLNFALILANGPVEIRQKKTNRGMNGCLIISSGDVTLNHVLLDNCLIIAKGKIDATETSICHSRIISGKTVKYNKGVTDLSIIIENEHNPLGYIQWEKPTRGESKN